MRRQLGIIVAASFYYSGLVKLARWHTERSWPCLVILNYHRASNTQVSEVTIDDRTYYLGKTGERRALALDIDTRLRHAGSVKEREAFLASARELLGVTEGVIVEGEIERSLTWAEVHEMEESDWV